MSAAVAVSDADPNSRLGPWRREETGRAVYVDSRNGAPCILKTPRTWQIFEDVKSSKKGTAELDLLQGSLGVTVRMSWYHLRPEL